MERFELIKQCRSYLGAAEGCATNNQHEHFAMQMQSLLDLLIEELVGSAPAATQPPAKHFNPEQVLTEIAIAIKHRTISTNHRWKIIYYDTRVTCVPTSVDVPPEIVLHEFTEGMVQQGFSVTYWNHLKANVVKLYKELKK